MRPFIITTARRRCTCMEAEVLIGKLLQTLIPVPLSNKTTALPVRRNTSPNLVDSSSCALNRIPHVAGVGTSETADYFSPPASIRITTRVIGLRAIIRFQVPAIGWKRLSFLFKSETTRGNYEKKSYRNCCCIFGLCNRRIRSILVGP